MARMKETAGLNILWVSLTLMILTVFADPDPLQDLCVADMATGTVKVNGFICKESSKVNASDFKAKYIGNIYGPSRLRSRRL
ncbi:hypothetical protein SUGI_0366080 [Cryptomeria japonica]|nr:hypothetical protein SUGI_0366080 [Cryptomeria japonica]